MRVRERSGSSEEPHEQELAARARAEAGNVRSEDAYRDAYAQAVLLPPPAYEDTERWSTLLAEDPIFDAPPPLTRLAEAREERDAEPTPEPESELALEVVPGPISTPPEEVHQALERESAQSAPPFDAVAEPVPSSEPLPLSQQPRSSGHFEDSVARAVETLDASTLLTSAGTDLKRRGNLLSTHAKKREEPPRLLRNRTPRSGSPAAREPTESATPLTTESPPHAEDPSHAIPESAPRPKRSRLLPIVAIASVVVGVGVTYGLATPRKEVKAADGASASVSTSAPALGAPPASSSARAKPTVSVEPVAASNTPRPATAEVAPEPKQPRTHGILRVDSEAPGRVFVQGIDVGPTNAFLELTCGMKFVRIAHASPPPPGQSFPNWVGDAKSVMVPCGQAHRVEFTPVERP